MATSALLADGDGSAPQSDRYRWTALSNTTLGVFMATLDSSIVIISLPAIFRGIHLNPLEPGNIGYLLWILMGYLVVTAVLVVTFGRIGDIFGRVRMYNLGFLIVRHLTLARTINTLIDRALLPLHLRPLRSRAVSGSWPRARPGTRSSLR
jgi:MFS family permease